MKILVCAATSPEYNSCKKAIRAAKNPNLEFKLLKTGMGVTNGGQKLDWFLWKQRNNKNFWPDLIISSGFCGAFSEQLHLGQWISSSNLLLKSKSSFDFFKFDDKHFSHAIQKQSMPAVVMTAPELVDYSAELRSRVSQYLKDNNINLPVAVDMESAAQAAVATRHKIPFLALRLVTDTPEDPFPKSVYLFTEALNRDQNLKTTQRLVRFAEGLRETFQNPLEMARFLKKSFRLTQQLESGWKEFLKPAN